MAKHHVFLHIGPDVVEIDAEVRERLAAVAVLTPDVSRDDLHRADLEIRRAHKAADLKRKDVEGAWAKVCRKTFRLKSDCFISEPGFLDADDDRAALAIDGLAGLKVHLVVTPEAQAELPTARTRLVKPERIHAIQPGLSSADFAAEMARIALSEEKARLDKSLLKLKKRRKQVKEQLAA
ncbi:hypothetical protein [Nocardioides sp. B-3]|uniref:hypothetical protein n=1 Tax=Nocardioides sp. B-3 TaxID=2895565 RepID=UPI002152088C|nr:hypothetical protein [Nocardioides sp. B-3]UUZ61339.1 hypothetical protein LP418_12615 [Nocardioides sp. B-3]